MKRLLHGFVGRAQSHVRSRYSKSVPSPNWSRGLMVGVGGATALAAGSTTVFADSGSKKQVYEEPSMLDTVLNLPMNVVNGIGNSFRDLYEFACGDQSFILAPSDDENKRTVVIGFEDTLLHAEWTRNAAWSFRKRPHAQDFLQRLYDSGYEVIIFASGNKHDWQDCVTHFDVFPFAAKHFYRDEQNFQTGKHIKDMNRLNRDMRNVIVIDSTWDETAALNPENAIHIKPFVDDFNDQEFLKLAYVLDKIREFNIYDVRTIIKQYNENPGVNPFLKFEKEKLMAEKLLRELDE